MPDTFVAELTGLLDLTRWPAGTRIIVRDEPLHPRYRTRATDRDRADWPWTPELLHAWTAVRALTAPT